MKHFIVEITYTAPPEQVDELLPRHVTFLKVGYDRGWLLFSGPQVPRVGGMIIARAPSREAIEQYFADDPYQAIGVYRFVEFDPVRRQPFMEEWATAES